MSEATVSHSRSRAVLVTGGAGFIGSHVVDALLGTGYRVRVIDDFSTGDRKNCNSSAELIEGDIRHAESIDAAFDGIDCVFHLAALPRVPLSIENPLETHLVNVVGTINVLQASRRHNVRRVIVSGSSSVYGDQPQMPLRETMMPNPMSPYALQKLAAEQYARLYHRLYGLETLTLRYFNVFGPRMASEGAYLTVISSFLQARLAGRSMRIDGDGEQTRDFTHVRDVVRANLVAMDASLADGRAINIGQGRSVSVNWIADRIGGPRMYGPPRPGDVRHTLADHGLATRVLGWTPRVTTQKGLDELLQNCRPQMAAFAE